MGVRLQAFGVQRCRPLKKILYCIILVGFIFAGKLSMMKKLLFVSLLFSLCGFSQQHSAGWQEDSVFIHSIANTIMSSQAAYDNLKYLTKKIGGRLAGSPQMVQAEQWGYKTMKDAGAENVIMQQCMVPHWVRGGKDKVIITYDDVKGKQQSFAINVLALGNSAGSGAAGVKAPLIVVNNFDELDKVKENVKGKIVFYNCDFDDTIISPFGAYGKNVRYRGNGASRAAKYGALAVLVRSMTNGTDNNPHTGVLRYNDLFPHIPAVAVGLDDVRKVAALAAGNIKLSAQVFTYGTMLPDTVGYNIIGELKGTEFPDEIITIGGHLDSWDVNEGAHDDGAGVVHTIEVLRALAALGYKPKHTIHFVLFANEENGTRGAKQYAEEAKLHNEKHIFALESDAGGFTPRGFGVSVNDEQWNKIIAWKGLFTPYYGDLFERGGGGADVGYLADAFKTPVGEFIPDSQRYFDVHHSASDILENVNSRELRLGAVNIAAFIYLVDKYGL